MQKHFPVKYRKSASLFTKFCSDMEILPPYTPIFLIDSFGRIVNKKRLVTKKEDFESIYNLVESEEIPFIHESSKTSDAFTVKGRIEDGRNFIVISKDRDGFSRCVVCSFSEERCTKLHDYIEKLYSYKDYLDSFANLAFSSSVRLPAKRIFKTRISGALSLVELLSGDDNDTDKKISFPVSLALEKLCAFAAKANGGNVSLKKESSFSESIINVPEAFFKLMTSALALVLRHSMNMIANVIVENVSSDDFVKITIKAASVHGESDIYERALMSALRVHGFECGVVYDKNEYSVFVTAPVYRKEELVLSDVAAISQRIDHIIDDAVLKDMFDTICDK